MVLSHQKVFFPLILGVIVGFSVIFGDVTRAEAGFFDWFQFSTEPEVKEILKKSPTTPLTAEQIAREKERIKSERKRIEEKRRRVGKLRKDLEDKDRILRESGGSSSPKEIKRIKQLLAEEKKLHHEEKELLVDEKTLTVKEKERIELDKRNLIEKSDKAFSGQGLERQERTQEQKKKYRDNDYKDGRRGKSRASEVLTQEGENKRKKRERIDRRLYLEELRKFDRDRRRQKEELEGNIRFGRFRVTPGLELSQRYNDNIFLEADKRFADGTREGKSEDLIGVISPYIKVTRKREAGERLGLSVLYRANQEKYVDLNALDNLEHDARGELDFSLRGNRIRGKLFTSFLQTQDLSTFDALEAVETSSVIATNFNARTARTDYKVGGNMSFSRSERFVFRLGTQFRVVNFEPSLETEDREDFETTLAAFWQWTPLTKLGLKYDYRNLHYNSTSTFNLDSNTHSVSLVAELEPTALVSGTFELGYVSREFIGSIAGRDNVRFNMDLEYKLTDRTRFLFGGRRSIEDSSFSIINDYVFTAVSVSWEQDWTRKISTNATLGFQNQYYDEKVADTKNSGGVFKERDDNGVNLDLAATYQIQKTLRAELEYRYNKNDSNFNELDYEKNSVVMSLKIAF